MNADEYVVEGNLPLRRGTLLRIAQGPGMLLYVWRGRVWITQEGDLQDHLVAAGGWFRVTRPGTTLVSGLQSSVLSLTSPRSRGFAERIDVVRASTGAVERLLAAATS